MLTDYFGLKEKTADDSNSGRSIVFIDSAVEDKETLVAGVAAGFEVIVLDPAQDGIEQISDVLARYAEINAVHIVCHGSPGLLQLGSTRLNLDNLDTYAPEFAAWKIGNLETSDKPFLFKLLFNSDSPAIFLYGCEVAAGEIGQAFVRKLSRLAGVPVAASANRIGSAAKGGNRKLEYTTGFVKASLAFKKEVITAYQGVFAGPVFEWIKQFGTAVDERFLGVATDSSGNVYTAGWREGDLGDGTGYSMDTTLAKYDSSGTLLWVKNLRAEDNNRLTVESVDGAGNVYTVVNTVDTAGAALLIKYDSSGTELWSAQWETPSSAGADAAGNVYIASGFGSNPTFVTKYDSTGNQVWVKQLGSAGWHCLDVAADSAGNVYMTGFTESSAGNWNYPSLVVKYDTSGTLQWSAQLGTAGYEYGHKVTVDGAGNVYIAGISNRDFAGNNAGYYDALVVKYDSSGNLQWCTQLGTASYDTCDDVAVDGAGNVYIAGNRRFWGQQCRE